MVIISLFLTPFVITIPYLTLQTDDQLQKFSMRV